MDKNEVNVPKIRFPGFTDPWEQRKFEKVFSHVKNNALSRDKLNYESGYAMNVHYGDVLIKFGEYLDVKKADLPMISDENVVAKYKASFLKNGDIIIADAAEDETVGKCCEIIGLEDERVLSGLHTIPCRPNWKFESLYLGYYMNSSSYHDQLLPLMQGTKVNSISKTVLKSTYVNYPQKNEEQAKIGAFFKHLDNLITLHQRKLNHLQDKKKGLLQKMFPRNGENFPELRFPEFTDPWEQRKFMEVFAERRDKTVVENEDILLSCAINGMFLNSELFGHFRGSSTIGYLKVKKNDLILSAQNLHLGNANVNLRFEHGIISPAYKVFEFIDSDPNFIQSWVKKDATKNFFLAATTEGASQCRKNIEWKTLYNQKMLLPSRKEQEVIGAFFNNIDNFITLHQRKLEHLQQQKKGLLQQMFI